MAKTRVMELFMSFYRTESPKEDLRDYALVCDCAMRYILGIEFENLPRKVEVFVTATRGKIPEGFRRVLVKFGSRYTRIYLSQHKFKDFASSISSNSWLEKHKPRIFIKKKFYLYVKIL